MSADRYLSAGVTRPQKIQKSSWKTLGNPVDGQFLYRGRNTEASPVSPHFQTPCVSLFHFKSRQVVGNSYIVRVS